MFNFFIATLITIVGILPESSQSILLEKSLREKIDQNEVPIQLVKTKNTPSPKEDFANYSSKSEAVYFIDTSSGMILYEKNSDKKLSPASISKLMTALVVVSEANVNEVVTIKAQDTRPEDATMGLVLGDKITVSELLHGLLLNSGSDAALNLSTHVAGSEEVFVKKMNEMAKALGLKNTNFTNSVGWDDPKNYSTAKELTILAQVALKNQYLKDIFSKKSHISTSEKGIKYHLVNTNKLLEIPGHRGIKTGTTLNAGECLVFFFDDGERIVVGTILDSKQRFDEVRGLIEWTRANFLW